MELKEYHVHTTTKNLLDSVWHLGSEAGGLVARLGYSRLDSQAGNRLSVNP
jgi:hypothetical protein